MYMLMYILYYNMQIGLQNMNKIDLYIIVPIFWYSVYLVYWSTEAFSPDTLR